MVKDHLDTQKDTHYHHMSYFWLAAKNLLYAPSNRQDSIYHGLC